MVAMVKTNVDNDRIDHVWEMDRTQEFVLRIKRWKRKGSINKTKREGDGCQDM